MSNEASHLDKKWIFDWLPLGLILGGLGLSWIGIDKYALMTYSGFASYGILGLVDTLRNKNLTIQILSILKIVTLILITVISIINLLGNLTYFVVLLALVLLDRIILTTNRLE